MRFVHSSRWLIVYTQVYTPHLVQEDTLHREVSLLTAVLSFFVVWGCLHGASDYLLPDQNCHQAFCVMSSLSQITQRQIIFSKWEAFSHLVRLVFKWSSLFPPGQACFVLGQTCFEFVTWSGLVSSGKACFHLTNPVSIWSGLFSSFQANFCLIRSIFKWSSSSFMLVFTWLCLFQVSSLFPFHQACF